MCAAEISEDWARGYAGEEDIKCLQTITSGLVQRMRERRDKLASTVEKSSKEPTRPFKTSTRACKGCCFLVYLFMFAVALVLGVIASKRNPTIIYDKIGIFVGGFLLAVLPDPEVVF
jgi:hypothetical protein